MKSELEIDRLKEYLHYDPETGVWTWLKKPGVWSSIKPGDIAGSISCHGYRVMQIDNKRYYSGRLILFYMLGYMPEYQAEHKNRIRDDDRWENLREATPVCNMRNRGVMKNNKTGITGVCWSKRKRKWRAHIRVKGKVNDDVGNFNEKTDAVMARWKAEVENNWSNCCTTSTAYLYLKERGLI